MSLLHNCFSVNEICMCRDDNSDAVKKRDRYNYVAVAFKNSIHFNVLLADTLIKTMAFQLSSLAANLGLSNKYHAKYICITKLTYRH